MQAKPIAFALLLAAWAVGASAGNPPPVQGKPAAGSLRPVAEFDSITDRRQRSMALFAEAGKVLQSPRCVNCHPVERSPTQGEDLHPHMPPVLGGDADHGVGGMPCNACHGARNVATLGGAIKSVPGNSHWSLAPASMAWNGKSLGDICAQLKDTRRNGGRSLAKIHEHMTQDPLVGWAWDPGEGRIPAPGTQEQFGALIQAWIDSGAVCPAS